MMHRESTVTMFKCPHVKMMLGTKVIKVLKVSWLKVSYNSYKIWVHDREFTRAIDLAWKTPESTSVFFTLKKVTDFHTLSIISESLQNLSESLCNNGTSLNSQSGVQWEFDDYIKAVSTEDGRQR